MLKTGNYNFTMPIFDLMDGYLLWIAACLGLYVSISYVFMIDHCVCPQKEHHNIIIFNIISITVNL